MHKENRFQFINNKKCENITALDATMSDFSYSKHAHEEYSLGVTLQGRQDFFCQKAFHKSASGNVIIFNPEDVHDGHSGGEQDLKYKMLYIHPDEFSSLFKSLGYQQNTVLRLNQPLFNKPDLRHQILSFSTLIQQPNYSKIELEAGLLQIAQSLIAISGKLDLGVQKTRRIDKLLLKAKDYILANIQYDISIDNIAEIATMSKFHFIRQFRLQFGITPHQYVLNCRVNLARKLIETGQSLNQTAFDAGFADNSHLNRHFKRIYGVTPKHFQKQLL